MSWTNLPLGPKWGPDEWLEYVEVGHEGRRERMAYVPQGHIIARDELIRDLYMQLLNAYDPKEVVEFRERMDELGIEAD